MSDKEAQRGEGVDFYVKNTGKRPHNFVLVGDTAIGLAHEGWHSGAHAEEDVGACRCSWTSAATSRPQLDQGRREEARHEGDVLRQLIRRGSALGPHSTAVASAAAVLLLCGCGSHARPASWPSPNGDLTGTRAAADARIDAGNVAKLHVRWRFRLTGEPGFSGIFASNPVVGGDTVYVQDLRSNVFALDRATGACAGRIVRRAERRAERSRRRRRPRLRRDRLRRVRALAPRLVASSGAPPDRARPSSSSTSRPSPGTASSSSARSGYPRAGRGAIYALDGATGAVRWKFDTITDPWRFPLEAGGGGLWYPPSIDATAALYLRQLEPGALGWDAAAAERRLVPGPGALHGLARSCSTAKSGRLLWYDQVTPHDVRDYDFQATPILPPGGTARHRRRQGGARHCLGPRHARAALAVDGRAPPQRQRPAAAPSRHGLPGPSRRRRDADGLRGRPAVRSGRRPLRRGARSAPAARRRWIREGQRTSSSRSTPDRARGSAWQLRLTGLRLRNRVRTTSCSPRRTTGRSTASRQPTAGRSGKTTCAPGSTRARR